MTKHETIIIFAAIVVIGYFWYKSAKSTTTANPTNATSTGFLR